MANRILIDDGYEKRVRSKMGVSEPFLPDVDINQPDVITVAEANIIALIPEYNLLEAGSDSRVYLESAVVLECCILLSPSMSARLPKKQAGPHESHELGVDWVKKKEEFEDEKADYVGKIIELEFPDMYTSSIPHFKITYPKREWQ